MFSGTLADSSSASSSARSKRYACDRCRKSKLRCPPREDASQACGRCLSLGVYCSTTTTATAAAAAATGVITTATAATTSTTTTTIATPSMSFLLQPGGVFPAVPPSADAFLPPPPPPPPPPGDPFSVLPVLSTGNHMSPAFSAEAIDWGHPGTFTPPARAESEIGLGACAPNAGGEPRSLSAIGCGTRLSHLRVQLSLHLQQCWEDPTGFWDGGDADADAKEHHQNHYPHQHHQHHQMAVRNPFGEALCYTSELLTIIRFFVQQQALGDACPSPSAPVPGTINLVTMLDILSAHTQMVSIYDVLFQRLYARLRGTAGPDARGSSSSGSSSFSPPPPPPPPTAAHDHPQAQFQALPGLHLAGFPVLQGTLQTKILMQAILHQFEALERNLALPAELRVSRRTDTYPGGLIGRDARTRHVVNSFLASSVQDATEHVISLRATIDQLTRLLNFDEQ